jgi:hypothetical protein
MNYSKTKMKTIDYPKTILDPVIAEVRRHKAEIAEAFDFDVLAIGRSLQRREIGDRRFKTPRGVQSSAEQPATASEPKSEASDKPQPESEGHSR